MSIDLNNISDFLIEQQIIKHPLLDKRSIGGGCINDCYKITGVDGSFFIKVNHAEKYPGMFQKEANGLKALDKANAIKIPEVIHRFEIDQQSFLLLEFLEEGTSSGSFWFDFGQQLANLHKCSNENFGFEEDNYIGSLPQKNTFYDTWAEFFLMCRLIPQIEMGIENGWSKRGHFNNVEQMAKVVEDEFPTEPAALLHGDLWSGNYVIGEGNTPCLVDPAVYYGNREMEIAFSKMFGGFSEAFYESYNAAWPLQEDFNRRIQMHQFYPILVHANLFGGHYAYEAIDFLKRY